jgi:hypothetical protein
MLWISQDAMVGSERSKVRLVVSSVPPRRQVVLKPPVEPEPISPKWRSAVLKKAEADVIEFIHSGEVSDKPQDAENDTVERSEF